MSEEPEEAVEPEDAEEQNPADYPSPLRSLITELHEIHQELQAVGFTSLSADGIVGHILYDAMVSRPMDEEDGEDFDDDINDNDLGDQ